MTDSRYALTIPQCRQQTGKSPFVFRIVLVDAVFSSMFYATMCPIGMFLFMCTMSHCLELCEQES